MHQRQWKQRGSARLYACTPPPLREGVDWAGGMSTTRAQRIPHSAPLRSAAAPAPGCRLTARGGTRAPRVSPTVSPTVSLTVPLPLCRRGLHVRYADPVNGFEVGLKLEHASLLNVHATKSARLVGRQQGKALQVRADHSPRAAWEGRMHPPQPPTCPLSEEVTPTQTSFVPDPPLVALLPGARGVAVHAVPPDGGRQRDRSQHGAAVPAAAHRRARHALLRAGLRTHCAGQCDAKNPKWRSALNGGINSHSRLI
jgi:hypothetical protein